LRSIAQRIRQRALADLCVIVLVLGAIGVMHWVGGMDRYFAGHHVASWRLFVFYALIVGESAARAERR